MIRNISTDDQGMTIIELLVVILIIGLLSAIAVPLYGSLMEHAKDKKMMTDLRNLAVAIGIYKVDNDLVPEAANSTELVVILKKDQGGSTPLRSADPWGNDFYYSYNLSTNSYTLMCLGKDGVAGARADEENFNAKNDTVVIDGVFVASHQGAASVAH